MNRILWLSATTLSLWTMTSTASAVDFYVNAASAAAPQGTQQNPFRTIQAAVDAAASGDRILVAAGTYVESVRIVGRPLILEGGYSSAWVRDIAGNRVTISGPAGNAVITLIESDTTIDGFRITGGTGSPEQLPYGYHGGGIYSRDGSPTISNNIIENNDIRSDDPPADTNFGGGVYVSGATSANILNNVVRDNVAGRGAGLFVNGQAALIEGNTIENNIGVGDHGGGMFLTVASARVFRNIIRGNEIGRAVGYGWGGGLIVANTGNSVELSFNVVYENFAAAYGAGEFIDEGATADIHHELIFRNRSKDGCEAVSAIAVDGGDGVGSTATIRHCTVVDNVCESATRGNGLQVEGRSTVRVINSIFWNNGGDDFAVDDTSTLTVTFTDSQEAISGTGNISADPRFLNAAAADFHLAAGSPCIDAGDPASPFANEPAPNGGRADMGRFGNAGDTPPPLGTFDPPSTGNTGGSGNDGGTGGDDVGGGASGAGLCPTASALLLTISVIGARRTRPARRERARG